MTPDDIPMPDWIRLHLRSFGPDGVLCIDGSGTTLGWNPQAVALLQEPHEADWLLKPITRVIGLKEPGQPAALFSEASEKGSGRLKANLAIEGRLSMEAELTAVRASPPGEPNCFLLYLRPVDQSVDLRRKMMELEVQHRMLLSRAGGLVLVVDLESGTVLHANEGAQEYLRATIGEIRGNPVVDLLQGVDAIASGDGLESLTQRGVREIELTIPSPTGQAWVLDCAANTISWHNKPALQWIGRDVTDRRASAAPAPPPPDLTESQVALLPVGGGARIPVEVVSPLAEELRHPAAQIERVVRHILANPDWPWRETRARLKQIQAQADHLRSGSEDLLYLSLLMSGTLDIRRSETTVGNLLGAVLPSLQRVARTRGSDLQAVQVDEDASLYTDARLVAHGLRRFLERPLSQADTTVTLTVAMAGDCIEFTLIDNAPALETAVLERILDEDAIYDLGAADADGSLPLLLSAHLFRSLGGHLTVQSSQGMGTRVALTLRC